ncbi:MAG: hypothetical protein HRT88_13215 [Lentisphaeraceae bacterium]|nr:hypothetical protein [Lentisphaeraceae bacterium]
MSSVLEFHLGRRYRRPDVDRQIVRQASITCHRTSQQQHSGYPQNDGMAKEPCGNFPANETNRPHGAKQFS